MDSLLSRVIDAHGGLDRWSRLDRLAARLTIGGPFWAAKGQPAAGGRKTVEADVRQQRIGLTPFAAADWDLEFSVDPEHVMVTDAEEAVVEERTDPRVSFAEHDATSPWDTLQTGYFLSYALWNYLTEPFLLSYPGFEAHEIDPSEQDGETWQRLQVTFPSTVATHNRQQVFYFDSAGMQRRLDYAPEINGDTPTAHYTDDHKTFAGIVAPTRHRVRRRLQDGTADMSVDYITIDIHNVDFHRS
jgi:hypothetical protein